MGASADSSDEGIGRIVMLLRKFIRLADCAEDCVAANAICNRIEQEASRASSNEVPLTLEEERVIRTLLRRLVALADSYDLASASAAVENLHCVFGDLRKSAY